jgi:hypothetical protein
MDKDMADLILLACHRSSRELADIVPMIKEYCSEEDRTNLQNHLGKLIYSIIAGVGGYVSEKSPQSKIDIERRVEKYGRAI